MHSRVIRITVEGMKRVTMSSSVCFPWWYEVIIWLTVVFGYLYYYKTGAVSLNTVLNISLNYSNLKPVKVYISTTIVLALYLNLLKHIQE